jgi:hypothetical protein
MLRGLNTINTHLSHSLIEELRLKLNKKNFKHNDLLIFNSTLFAGGKVVSYL